MLNRVIISGGGTGGHIFPAVAIANEIKRRNPDCKILFVGALGRMEMEKVPQAGYEIIGLPIAGIQRKLTLSNLLVPFKLIRSILMARKIVADFEPEVVVGVGGYASAAVLYAASLRKVPCLIQEQNSYAGLTNKWLSKKAKKICVAYEGMERFFPADKIILTGNPVRKEIYPALNADRSEAKVALGFDPSKPLLLVTGGSLGAGTINRTLEAGLEKLCAQGVQVLWQTGKNFKSTHSEINGVRIQPFINDMCGAYSAADLVVARAGAISVSEMCLIHKACILVPAPQLAEDHQTKNAMALVNKGAAVLVKDIEASEKLVNKVVELIKDNAALSSLESRIAELSKPDAVETIVLQIENLKS